MMKKNPSVFMFFITAIIMMVMADRALPVFDMAGTKISMLMGFLMMSLGSVQMIWAVNIFRNKKMKFLGQDEPETLITTGPFAYTRNPIYLGMIIFMFGLFFMLGSVTSLLLVFIFGGLVEDKFIMQEEQILGMKFGNEYTKYKMSVSRWFPAGNVKISK